MLKFGHISDIDADNALVRVKFDDDGFVSHWIPVSVPGAQGNKYFHIPDPGDHVWCIMDEFCNTGVVGGSIYDQDNHPDSPGKDITNIKFKDGAVMSYDRAGKVATVKINNTEWIIQDDGFTMKRSSETLKKVISDLLDGIIALTVTTPMGPSGTPINATTFTQLKTRLGNLFKN